MWQKQLKDFSLENCKSASAKTAEMDFFAQQTFSANPSSLERRESSLRRERERNFGAEGFFSFFVVLQKKLRQHAINLMALLGFTQKDLGDFRFSNLTFDDAEKYLLCRFVHHQWQQPELERYANRSNILDLNSDANYPQLVPCFAPPSSCLLFVSLIIEPALVNATHSCASSTSSGRILININSQAIRPRATISLWF